ncbi:MAG TPA: CarD family transcriptional regulator [Myxococcales bacterium]|nr:CarD family transcriptional regulator [Myxococcales bacterium]
MANKTTEIQIGDGSLHVGDRVVYPNQGICRITGVEVKQIAGRDWEVVTLSREEDGATVMVPRAKVMGIGLRKVASVAAIDDMFDQLAAPGDDPQLDWKVRHRENADRMTGGGLQGTLDVLKGLHALSRVRPLPQKERELYDSARHLLVGEIAAAMNLPLHVAEDNLDYALWPPSGMKRKGKALQPATLAPPGSSGTARPASRSGDGELDEDLFEEGEEADVEGDGEPAAARKADEEESEIADRDETKDLVRQRAMRVAAEEEEPEALDELAEDALEATHEDEAAIPSARLHAPPGTTKPQAKRGAAPPPPRTAPPPATTPPRAEARTAKNGSPSLAKSVAATALEIAAKVIAPKKPAAKAKAPVPKKPPARPAAKAKKPAASKPKKAAAKKTSKKPRGKAKR